MAELADAPALGAGGRPCRFKSCYPHNGGETLRNRKTVFCAALFAAVLLAGCGTKGQAGGSAGSSAAASPARTSSQASAEASTAGKSAAGSTAAAKSTSAASKSSAASSAVSSDKKKCKVLKHQQDGKAIVMAGGMSISVPTTFTGLEKDGFVFSGADEIIKAGESASCRVGYKGAFVNIKLNVKNTTADSMKLRECTIKGVEVASSTADPDLSLYGIPMGATWTDVLSTYGKPFTQTDPDDNGVSSVTYQFGTDINSKQVVFVYFKEGNVIDATYDDFSLIR
jgi:hypothetical protein